jgi:hypothetical protein
MASHVCQPICANSASADKSGVKAISQSLSREMRRKTALKLGFQLESLMSAKCDRALQIGLVMPAERVHSSMRRLTEQEELLLSER